MKFFFYILRAKYSYFVCKIPLRALGLNAEQAAARPSARDVRVYCIQKVIILGRVVLHGALYTRCHIFARVWPSARAKVSCIQQGAGRKVAFMIPYRRARLA